MKLLGFQDRAAPAIPKAGERDPGSMLLEEDADQYLSLITHLVGDDPLLLPYYRSLLSGETVVVVTGQQPALLGGPLYTLFKTMTAIEAARQLRELGLSAIAAFWCVGDDTDHDEVAFSMWPRHREPPARERDEGVYRGERIGQLDVERMLPVLRRIGDDWPSASDLHEKLAGIITASATEGWSGFLKRSLDLLTGEEPLLFIDGNDPLVISVSQAFLRRFVSERSKLASEIAVLADELRAKGEEPALTGEEAHRCLFVVDGSTRRQLGDGEEVDETVLLLPNVILRPALQEYLLPVTRVVCGDAEIAYRLLLGPVYRRLGKPAAVLMPRFSATFFPHVWGTDPGTISPGAALRDPDSAIDEWTRERLDPALIRSIGELRSWIARDLRLLENPLGRLDRSLSQVLDSAAGKIDFQLGRIEQAVLSKGRHALFKEHSGLVHLKENLLPRGKPQERCFTMWTPLLCEGEKALRDLHSAVDRWFERGGAGHALLAYEKE